MDYLACAFNGITVKVVLGSTLWPIAGIKYRSDLFGISFTALKVLQICTNGEVCFKTRREVESERICQASVHA